MVCIAEQFAIQAADDGNRWLDKKAVPMIESCKMQGENDENVYFYCLQANLKQITNALSSPCAELGDLKLWDEQICRNLISYIFVQDFEKVLEANKPPVERIWSLLDKASRNMLIIYLFNPITAILLLIFLVFDIILFLSPGNWFYASKMSLIFGPAIFISCFLKQGMLVLCAGIVIVSLLMIIVSSHIFLLFKPDHWKKKTKKIK